MAWAILILFMAVLVGGSEDDYSRCYEGDFGSDSLAIICKYVYPRLENLTSGIQQLVTKFHDHNCETYDSALHGTRQAFDLLESNLNSEFAKQGRALKELTVRVENIEKQAEMGLAKISALESTMEERFNKLSQSYDDMSQMLKKILDTVSDKAEGITNLVQKQTQKIEQQEHYTLNEFRKQEARTQETSKAVTVISNGNHKLIQNYQQLERAGQKLDNVERKLENVLKQAENAATSDENQTRKIDALNTVILKGFERQESNLKGTSNVTCENTSLILNTVERTEAILNNLLERIPPNTEKILETVSNGVQTIHKITLREWNFITIPRYANVRMVTNLTDQSTQITYPKTLGAKIASYTCILQCEESNSCKAVNIIDKAEAYVCELLADNLCFNQSRNALLNWPGSILWEKNGKSCLDEKFPSGRQISCEALRPGCFGIWPHCTKCFKTCKDFSLAYGSRSENVTFWPEGDGPFKTPIFGQCFGNRTVLLRRAVNVDTAALNENYLMSFADMHRVNRLRDYPRISFNFWSTSGNLHFADYDYPNIAADGTLSNITLIGYQNMNDIFTLNGKPLKPTPFVTVTDDRHSCGSFWLLDTSNPMYCPGGLVAMLGSVKKENGKVITGMSIPESFMRKDTIKAAHIVLEG